MYNIRTYLSLFILLIALPEGRAQTALETYIQEGLSSNRVLTEKNISLEQSQLALKTAKSYYMPSLDLVGTYTLANGGRTIDLPLGDLLNSAYGTLNELTGTNQFPQLENEQVQFFPNNFYDARARVSYAVINPDRNYGSQIREQQVGISVLEIEVYRADLKRDIKQAYFTYAIAETAVDIYREALALVERNLRNNQSLLDNGSGLPAYVLRAESEVEDVKTRVTVAKAKRKNAGYYLNFLVNRPVESPIVYSQPDLTETAIPQTMTPIDVDGRAELLQLELARNIAEIQVKNSKAFIVPELNTFLDLGSQGFNFDFDDQSRYYLFGLELSVPIFNGNRNRIAIRNGELNSEILRLREENVKEQLTLAASVARNNISSALSTLENARKKRTAARSYFRLVETGFTAGTNAYIEYLDARNQLTNAELDVALTYFQLLNNQAILERELASTTTPY